MNHRRKCLLMAGAFMCLNVGLYAQTVDLNLKKVSVENAITQLQEKSGYSFVYATGDLNINKLVTVNANQLPEAVKQILKGQDVTFDIQNKNIIIRKKQQSVGKVQTVIGIVKDVKGNPIIGATILVQGTTIGSITDLDGKFKLDAPQNAILEISYIGFKTQKETLLTGKKDIVVILKEDTELLDEVVVIGYGTSKKSDLTGAVGSVDMEDVNKAGVTSADRALQGQVAGVQVNARTGQPGDGMMIRVRGSNSLTGGSEPLYIIDNVPVESMSSDINPEDILSMEVLKDASSTAIYGSRGANGVVLITTKRGKKGKTSVEYNGYIGIAQLRKKIDVLGKSDYIEMVNEVAKNDGKGIAITPDQAAKLPDVDWQDLAYQNALTHSHQLSVSGGNEKSQVYTSLNYMNQEGIIKGSNYNRFALRINGDQKISDKLSLNASIAYSYGTKNSACTDADGGGSIAYQAMVMAPIQGVYDDEGKYTSFNGVPWGGTNPVGVANTFLNRDVNSKLLANLALSYDIIEGLNFRVNAGAEINANEWDRYIPMGISAAWGQLDGDAAKSKSNYYTLINENILTYNKKFNNKHSLNVMGGVTFQTYKYNSLSGSGHGFLRDIYTTNNLGVAATKGTPSSGYSDSRMVSFLGRVNYNLKERYLFTATARYDGSSKFSKNKKFAFFPSAAVAWRMSEEDFMKDIDWLSNLKVRTSIGQTGNQSISPYQTFARIGTGAPIFGNGQETSFGLSSIANDDLKWETTTQEDLGLDLGLWGNRLTFSFDYYWKQTRDLLYNATLPPSSGFRSMLRNLGRIDNRGWEVAIKTVNMKGKVDWTTSFNISGNKSIVKDLGSDVYGKAITRIDAPIAGGNWFPLFLGHAPFQLYGYEIEGIYQTDEEARLNGEATKKAGDYRYKDIDGKQGIDAGDKKIIGNTQPKFTFGLTNEIYWNNFDFSFLITGSVGGDIVNEFNKYFTAIGGSWNVRKEVWEKRWQEGKGGKYPRASASTKDLLTFGDPNSAWVENGTYVRFKDIKVGYTIPSSVFRGSYKPTISLYLSAQNLITFTSYSHYDPEASWTSSAVNGWDRGVYPSSKSFTLGLKLKL